MPASVDENRPVLAVRRSETEMPVELEAFAAAEIRSGSGTRARAGRPADETFVVDSTGAGPQDAAVADVIATAAPASLPRNRGRPVELTMSRRESRASD
jgi:hypothetical protein